MEALQTGTHKDFVTLTAEDVKHPEFSRFREGQVVGRKFYQDALKGPAAAAKAPEGGWQNVEPQRPEPTRAITMEGRPAAAPAAGGPNGPGVGKGLPGTRLARRAAALERVKAAAAAEPKPLEFLKGGAPEQSSLEAQLAGSIEAEQAMKQAGISAAERAVVRNALRAMGGNALQLLPFIIGAKPLSEQINEAGPLLDKLNMFPKRPEPKYGEPGYSGPI
jgi:hypothetical protein